MDKKRIIVDYKTLPEPILEAMANKYPDGYSDSDIIKFKNSKGDMISAIRFETEDTIYMVKVSVHLRTMIEEYESDEEEVEAEEEDSVSYSVSGDDDDDDDESGKKRGKVRNDYDSDMSDDDDDEEDEEDADEEE